uniref:Uncharacterized protein n=1 Tax=Oryzias sinensis TaxID=183150 RepID=A0A8C7WUP2_9TELE
MKQKPFYVSFQLLSSDPPKVASHVAVVHLSWFYDTWRWYVTAAAGMFNGSKRRLQSDPCLTTHPWGVLWKSWRSVVACSSLRVGQTCNLTRAFKDPFSTYRVRVRVVTLNQTSKWTESGPFEPISDTVFGPPRVSVSGCGSCMVLRLSVPPELKRSFQLGGANSEVLVHVQRTRDRTEVGPVLGSPQEQKWHERGSEKTSHLHLKTLVLFRVRVHSKRNLMILCDEGVTADSTPPGGGGGVNHLHLYSSTSSRGVFQKARLN